MLIDEMIEELQKVKEEHGNIPVELQTTDTVDDIQSTENFFLVLVQEAVLPSGLTLKILYIRTWQ